MKNCPKCDQIKPVNCFHNDRSRHDGKYPICKECHYRYTRERHQRPDVKQKKLDRYHRIKNTEKYKIDAKDRGEKFYNSVEGRARTLFNNAKKSSKKHGHTFNLTLEKLIKTIESGVCQVTGVSFEMNNDFRKMYKKNPLSPSIDRIDPMKGYTDENTRIVIWWYNMAKGELSDLTMKDFCSKVTHANV